MRKFSLIACGLMGLLILLSCTKSTGPGAAVSPVVTPGKTSTVPSAKTGWEFELERTAEAARKEGAVVVYMTAGAEVRQALTRTFKDRYGVTVEALNMTGREMAVKITRERQSGLFLADVYQGGVTTPVTLLKPINAFDPLEPVFILPELKDPELIKKTWYEGKLLWVDKDKMILPFLGFAIDWALVNTDIVKTEEMKSLRDLLNPKWKGKLLMYDPAATGVGGKLFGTIGTFGPGFDFWRELAKQEPVIMRDHRLMAEWIAQGKYAIAVAPRPEESQMMKDAGAHVTLLLPPVEGSILTTGSGGLSLMNKAAHPNAAKLYINWLLSKEGLTTFTKAYGAPSLRLDVPTDFLPPEKMRQPDVKYIWPENEEYLAKETTFYTMAREIFGIR